jgi:Asp-tRNA(Asn)/Glu-tRNA(Gln) amidotransferase A subunit family amidase
VHSRHRRANLIGVKPLHELSASEALPLLRDGSLTSEELVGACLRRIEAEDGRIGAFEHLDPAAALAAARRVDRTSPKPPLAGLPVAAKDIIDTADLPTECGFAGYRGRRPARDAACIARLRAAGAVLLGKTVTTELAFYQPGKTRNPRDLARTPGGSSSGSAAAVAARLAPAALGSQTAGSIIRPASFCGVVGFKPTHGLIPLDGVSPFAPSLDTLGLLVRRVADVPPLLAALVSAGAPAAPAARLEGDAGPPRLALCRTEQWPLADASTRALVEDAATRLARAGADVAELELGAELEGLAAAQRAIMAAEAARSFRDLLAEHGDLASAVLRDFVREGEGVLPEREEAARRQAERGRAFLSEAFRRFDALVTPSAVGEAPVGLGSTGDPAFNRIWTLLGAPCVSLPAARGPAGMPVGVQLVGAVGEDGALLAVAEWAERALDAAS